MAEPKKKATNSKAKGNSFEGKISKLLTEFLVPLKFKRVTGSGGYLGGQNVIALENYSFATKRLFIGDVGPTNEGDEGVPLFRFSIECKFYKDCENFYQLLNGKSKIFGWLEESRVDAAKLGVEPILIFRFNLTDDFVAVDKGTELPSGTPAVVLPNGDKIALLRDLMKPEHRDWWLR